MMDAAIEAEIVKVLERFCAAFADRDGAAIMMTFGPEPDPELVVVTSEQSLLRGPVELGRFLDRYVVGPTTYSWKWDRHQVCRAGAVAWLIAEGTETAVTDGREEQHSYRMTMVLQRRDDRWDLMQVHGSSPH